MVYIETYTVRLFHIGCECEVTGFDVDLSLMGDAATQHIKGLVREHYEPDIIVKAVSAA